MKKLFIGIDISKDVFFFFTLDEDHNILSSNMIEDNSIKGINKFCKSLKQLKSSDIWITMEHTGRYGTLLCTELSKQNICFSLVNPLEIKYSIGIARGKNDAIDAYRIASYSVTNKHKLKPYRLPIKALQKLNVMMSVRDLLVKTKVQLKNTLKSLEVISSSVDIKDQIKMIKASIRKQENDILKIENQMMTLINDITTLNDTYNKITQVIGVGKITAIKTIIETDNFSKFTDGRKFCCHCGLAPFEYSSGSSVRGKTKTSKICNKGLKGILFKAASTAIQHDPQLKLYYHRKVNEGKHKLSVLNAVANKLVLRIFAVAKRNEPFVKLVA